VIALQADPGPGRPSMARMIAVDIPRPRDQLTTKEHPEFLRLRRELFTFIAQGHD
jgi:NitT/TauT family transport system ATP-binding protein